jgi:hypothetical protein
MANRVAIKGSSSFTRFSGLIQLLSARCVTFKLSTTIVAGGELRARNACVAAEALSHFVHKSRYRHVAMMRGQPSLGCAHANVRRLKTEPENCQDAIGGRRPIVEIARGRVQALLVMSGPVEAIESQL